MAPKLIEESKTRVKNLSSTGLVVIAVMLGMCPAARATMVILYWSNDYVLLGADSKTNIASKCKIGQNQAGSEIFSMAGEVRHFGWDHYDLWTEYGAIVDSPGTLEQKAYRYAVLAHSTLTAYLHKHPGIGREWQTWNAPVHEAIIAGFENGRAVAIGLRLVLNPGNQSISSQFIDFGYGRRYIRPWVALGRDDLVPSADFEEIQKQSGALGAILGSIERGIGAEPAEIGPPVNIIMLGMKGLTWITPSCDDGRLAR